MQLYLMFTCQIFFRVLWEVAKPQEEFCYGMGVNLCGLGISLLLFVFDLFFRFGIKKSQMVSCERSLVEYWKRTRTLWRR